MGIFNFHYATPPDTVAMNYALNKPIGDDETGFKGSGDFVYRAEGWDFLLAGGSVYSNLDDSFTPEHESGTARVKAPGGGGAALRKQLQVLKDFLHTFEFVRMAPDARAIVGGVPTKATARALVEKGKQYAVYVRGGRRADLVLNLPAGSYRARWFNTQTGAVDKTETFRHAGGKRTLASPPYSQDIALAVRRTR